MKLKFPLRDWQSDALDHWCENSFHGIVEVVTGGGKTVFAEACMQRFREAYPNGRILIVVPTVALADQWSVSLEEEFLVNSDVIHVGRKKYDSSNHVFSVMVINSARHKEQKLSLKGDWMLVVDECHRAGSEENRKALKGRFVAALGLSATPERPYDDALTSAIAPILGQIIYTYDLKDARRDGIVTPFELINARIALQPHEQKEYARLSRVIGIKKRNGATQADESIQVLLRRRANVSNRAIMRIPVTAKLIEQHSGERVMAFHEDVAAVESIAAIVRARGHSVTTYHTKISTPIRRSNLKLYRRGVYRALLSCRALDEGINIPETQVAIIAAGSATARQRIQRLGRVLRPAPGKACATVYSLYATDIEEKRLIKEARLMSESNTATVRWLRVEAK